MKIAVDARILRTSTGRYVERLLHHLQEVDHENEYVVLLRQADFDGWQPAAPNFTKLVADYPPYTLREQFQFARQLYGLRADVVHFTQFHFPLLYWRPFVVTVHDLTLIDFVNRRPAGVVKAFYKYTLKPLVFKVVLWWAARFARAVIALTNYGRQDLIKRLGARPEKVVVTYEAADPWDGSGEPKRPQFIGERDRFLLYVGNAFPYKNLWRMIQAFADLRDPNLKLVLVGKREYFYEELERRTRAAGIGKVVFAGFTPDNEVLWLGRHAQAYVMASRAEGWGLPPLGAMREGLPVISSNATCLPEVYGEAAEYFDPLDVAAMTRAMRAVLDDEHKRNELRAAGHGRRDASGISAGVRRA
jgi:glycosyltransferase involved in cell wall biosynthesis